MGREHAMEANEMESGRGTSAATRCKNTSGVMTRWVVLSRYGVLSWTTTSPAGVGRRRLWLRTGRVIYRHRRSSFCRWWGATLCVDRFAALAEPNRRRMIEILAKQGEIAATDISDQFDISPPAVSQHLKVLREAELVNMEKRPQQRIYSLNPQGVDEMWEWLNQMRQFWNEHFDALDVLLLKKHNEPKGKK